MKGGAWGWCRLPKWDIVCTPLPERWPECYTWLGRRLETMMSLMGYLNCSAFSPEQKFGHRVVGCLTPFSSHSSTVSREMCLARGYVLRYGQACLFQSFPSTCWLTLSAWWWRYSTSFIMYVEQLFLELGWSRNSLTVFCVRYKLGLWAYAWSLAENFLGDEEEGRGNKKEARWGIIYIYCVLSRCQELCKNVTFIISLCSLWGGYATIPTLWMKERAQRAKKVA